MKKNELKDKVFSDKFRVPGVYRIVFINGTNPVKYYYGSTGNLWKRRIGHRSKLKCGTHDVDDMRTDCNTFGIESFHFEVISIFATVEQAKAAEEVLLYANGGNSNCYNISKLADPALALGPDNPSWNKAWTQDWKDKRTTNADIEREARITYKIANGIPLSRNDKFTPAQREAQKQRSLISDAKIIEKRHAAKVLRASALTPFIPLTSP